MKEGERGFCSSPNHSEPRPSLPCRQTGAGGGFICHGDKDPTIDVSHTEEFVKNLLSGKVLFFKIANASHKVWDYLTPEILEEFKSWV